jgi:hypothetical protein
MFPAVTVILPVSVSVVIVCEAVPAAIVALLPLRIEDPASLMLKVSAVAPSEACVRNLHAVIVPVTGSI